MANGGYVQGEQAGIDERTRLIKAINDEVDEMIANVIEPQPDFEEILKTNPFFAQGQAGLEKLRFDYRAGRVDLDA